ncbi:hypothetical protein PO909_016595 [Leuciscus waleckii]
MEEELQGLRELVAQLRADNTKLRQDQALAGPSDLGHISTVSGPSLAPPPAIDAGAISSERYVFIPRDRRCPKFNGRSGVGITEWVEEAQACMRSRHLSVADKAFFLFDHLEGEARDEIKYRPAGEREDPEKIIAALKELYGCSKSYVALQEAFFSRRQHDGSENSSDLRGLMSLLEQVKQQSPTVMPNAETLLRDQFVEQVVDSALCRELKQFVRRQPSATLLEVRREAIRWEQEGMLGKLAPVELQSHSSVGGNIGSDVLHIPDPMLNLMSPCPHINALLGGISVPCLIDTGSMVSTLTESCFLKYFEPWGQERLRTCQWLQLKAANGLSISYIGYMELDVELCGKLVPKCGVLVVKDPPGGMCAKVPGVLGMNVLGKCYQGLLGQHGPSLFEFPPVASAPVFVVQALQYCHQTSTLPLVGETGQVKTCGPRAHHIPGGTIKLVAATCSEQYSTARLMLDLSLLSGEEQCKVRALLLKYQSVFSAFEGDLGCTNIISHDIPLTDDTPVRQRYRRIPPSEYEVVRAHINQLLDAQVVRESCSPYASPIVLVKKKDGSLRICVDYRQLNAKTRKDAFPLPRIEESLDALTGARWFSTLDLTSGYNQVPVSEGDKSKTAFCTPFGLFEWNRMPFGLCNAPSTFQRLMQRLFGDQQCQSLLLYLDDIVVFSSSVEQHLERLEVVLSRLEHESLKVKMEKC